MPYSFFHEKFPEIGRKETRSFQSFNKPELRGGEFGLLEMYCDEPGCDCRRVMFYVVSEKLQDVVAYIGYGWEDAQFYMKRFNLLSPDDIRELQGPSFNLMMPQSHLAPAILEVIEYLLEDENYVNRIKRHYKMFRTKIEKEAGRVKRQPHRATKRKPKKPRR